MKRLVRILLFLAFAFGLVISVHAENPNNALGEIGKYDYEGVREDGDYSVYFAFRDAYAEIGHPFPIEYSVSGGSGSYTDLEFDVLLCTEVREIDNDLYESVDGPSGTWNMTAPVGKYAIVYLYGKDAVTGEVFWIESGKTIEIRQNPDYPVIITFDKDEYIAGDTINVQYTISGLAEELADGKVRWVIRKSERAGSIG